MSIRIDPATLLSDDPYLASGDLEMMPKRGCSELLEYLWARYRQRFPYFSHLETRWSRMRELGIKP